MQLFCSYLTENTLLFLCRDKQVDGVLIIALYWAESSFEQVTCIVTTILNY